MPVTKEQIQEYLAEIGLPDELSSQVLGELEKDQTRAAQFVGQRLRHNDYTKKTQQLAQEKQSLDQQVAQQVQAYAQELANAQSKIDQIMQQYEQSEISKRSAEMRLSRVKEKYGLDDNDIPALDQPPSPKPKPEPGIDIDGKLADFKKSFMAELRGELLSLPRITARQVDMDREYHELTGKKLTRKEWDELISEAEKQGQPLESVWEQKFTIPDLRLQKRDEANQAKWRQEWEAEQKKKATEDALSGVRNRSAMPAPVSPVLAKQFKPTPDPLASPGDKSQPAGPPAGPALSGAERAAAKWMERRSQGIPLGASEPDRR